MNQTLNVILTVLFAISITSTSFASSECMPNALSYAREDLNEKFKIGQLNAYSWQRSDEQIHLNLKGYSVKSTVKVTDHNKDSFGVEFELEDPYRQLPELILEADIHGLNLFTNNCRNEDLDITYKVTFINE